MQAKYSFSDLHIAQYTIAYAKEVGNATDRFGNPLVPIEAQLWATRVLLFFTKLWSSIRWATRKFKLSWSMATKYIWGRFKLGIEKILDYVPI
jgi:hypothetical protein